MRRKPEKPAEKPVAPPRKVLVGPFRVTEIREPLPGETGRTTLARRYREYLREVSGAHPAAGNPDEEVMRGRGAPPVRFDPDDDDEG